MTDKVEGVDGEFVSLLVVFRGRQEPQRYVAMSHEDIRPRKSL
jgi:hypothetical protein